MGILAGVALFAALLPRAHSSSDDAGRFALDHAILERTDSAGNSRYTVTGHWTIAKAPNARYEVKAVLETDGATCGAQGRGPVRERVRIDACGPVNSTACARCWQTASSDGPTRSA